MNPSPKKRLSAPYTRTTSPGSHGSIFCTAPARPRTDGTFLIAADEPVEPVTADALLRHTGFQTVPAADGHEAVQPFRASPQRIAAVLPDLTRPGRDGAEVLRVIRALHPDVSMRGKSR